MPAPVEDLDELINAADVAAILGLTHRNSVSTYRSRYADFPAGQPAPGGGRTLLWRRGEIVAWHRAFSARRAGPPEQPSPRLEELVAATVRLMLAQPGTDVSIRQIAAEAGVAHSDLYRYASSKEELQRLAVQRINDSFTQSMPTSYPAMVDALPQIYESVLAVRAALRVMAHEMITDPETPVHGSRIAISVIAENIAAHRAETGAQSDVDPRVVAACMGGLAWGLALFGGRFQQGVDLPQLPTDQVARVMQVMLEA